MRKVMRINWRRRAQEPVAPGKHEKGQSLVEVAIALPVLILILAAVIDFARAFDAYIVLTNAAREGARFGARDPMYMTPAEIQQMVTENVTGSGTNVTLMQDFAPSDVAATFGTDAVSVTVTYDFGLWFGGLVGADTLQLNKTAVMPIMTAP